MLFQSVALLPRLLYSQTIHKPGIPLRPVVSSTNSRTFVVHLYKFLETHIGLSNLSMKDSANFIEKIKTVAFKHSDILVNFEVVSLFTKVTVTV